MSKSTQGLLLWAALLLAAYYGYRRYQSSRAKA